MGWTLIGCIRVPFSLTPSHAQLLDLRKKFEEDKKRLAELKSSRKFKPLGSKFADDAS